MSAFEEWNDARKQEGCWVICCSSCGAFFAQKHKGRAGRPAVICDRQICLLAYRWQRKHHRLPPEWLCMKWQEQYGESLSGGKKYPLPRMALP